MYRHSCLYVTAVIFAGLLSACSSSIKNWNPDDYTVKSGDTVYSIAWRYEIDPEDFADWNRLGASKVIRPGQRLHTRKPKGFVSSAKTRSEYSSNVAHKPKPSSQRAKPVKRTSSRNYSNQKWVKVGRGDTLSGISQRHGVSVERLAQLNQLKKPYVIHPGQTIFLKPLKTASASKPVESQPARGSRKPSASGAGSRVSTASSDSYSWPGTVRWQRPAKGKVIKKFNRHRNDAKGIEISGRKGDAIVAAAGGKVVYSGDGLINYGNLIIIKHNNTFLSAYAYNHRLLVKEGAVVRAGQKIAEMGRKGNSSPRLHFEIRKNGKPADPLKYLPR
jgi:lipoprotein NlpD